MLDEGGKIPSSPVRRDPWQELGGAGGAAQFAGGTCWLLYQEKSLLADFYPFGGFIDNFSFKLALGGRVAAPEGDPRGDNFTPGFVLHFSIPVEWRIPGNSAGQGTCPGSVTLKGA